MKYFKVLPAVAAIIAFALASGCKDANSTSHDADGSHAKGVYYWKNHFMPSNEVTDFISDYDIDRLYMRFFEVVYLPAQGVVPSNTLWTSDKNLPKDVEIVPTIYITTEALSMLYGRTSDLACKIVSRITNMAEDFGIDPIKEVQVDCDWAASNRQDFFSLCSDLTDELHAADIKLSATIRLHQLSQPVPPVDRGVLMVYNVGDLKSPNETNSILNLDVVKRYLDAAPHYELPLDVAYPTFGWGVVYRDGRFLKLMHIDCVPDSMPSLLHLHDNWYKIVEDLDDYYFVDKNDIVRYERSSADQVIKAKKMVEKYLGYKPRYTILYHLDEQQLSHYSPDEINEFYE